MAVLVIYERKLEQVSAWPWLRAALRDASRIGAQLVHVLIYDNSTAPMAQAAAAIEGCSYFHDPDNGGTAVAYQRAAALAAEAGIEWLLLLDQDTQVPPDFLRSVADLLANCRGQLPAALVPWVVDHGQVVSPATVTSLGGIRPLKRRREIRGIRGLTAVASGSLLRIESLRRILPLPRELWLDYVDHWIFARFNLIGAHIAILDEVLPHTLSIMRPAQLSPRRLGSILDGERYFQGLLGPLARAMYPLRLLARVVRYVFLSPRQAIGVCQWMTATERWFRC